MVDSTKLGPDLAAALVKVQAAIAGRRVSSSSMWDICAESLIDSGLELTQTISLKDGVATITTTLRHESGQQLLNSTNVPSTGDGRIGPFVEMLAFHSILGLFGLAAPNEDISKPFVAVVE